MTVYQFGDRRFLEKVRRLRLCTGEAVTFIDDDTFELATTGERLTRVIA